MDPRVIKLARHFMRQHTVKCADDDHSVVAPAAAAGGLGLVSRDAHSLISKLDRAKRHVNRTVSNINTGPVVDPVLGYEVPYGIEHIDHLLDAYNKGMQGVAKSRVMGIPAGRIYSVLSAPPDILPGIRQVYRNDGTLREYLQPLQDVFRKPQYYTHHNATFGDPRNTVHNLRGHAIEQSIADISNAKVFNGNQAVRELFGEALGPAEIGKHINRLRANPEAYGMIPDEAQRLTHEIWKLHHENKPASAILNYLSGQPSLPHQARNFLFGGSPATVVERLRYLESEPHALGLTQAQASDISMRIRRHLLGGPNWRTNREHVGHIASMVGGQHNILGQAVGYAEGAGRKLRGIRNATGMLAIPALAYAGINHLRNNKRINFSHDKMASFTDNHDITGAGALAGGSIVAGAGAMSLNAPRDIRMTYGTMSRNFGGPNITAGHKNPTTAIREILNDKSISPWYSKYFTVGDDIVRGPGGILSEQYVRPNVLIDTGFGALFSPPNEKWVPRFIESTEHIRPLSVMSYLTDPVASSMRHAGATTSIDPHRYGGVRRDILGYGNNIHEYVDNIKRHGAGYRNVHLRYLGNSMGPAISNDAVANAMQGVPDRGKLMRELADYYRDPKGGNNPQLADAFTRLHDKKLLVISGSSRGDYVAQRAYEYANELKRRGVSDVQVIAQLGDAIKDPLVVKRLADSGVIQAGRMPNKLYTGLQGIADMHDMSLGASAAAEAAASSTPLVVTPWGKWGGRFPKANTIAGKYQRYALKEGIRELFKSGRPITRAEARLLINILKRPFDDYTGLSAMTGRLTSGDIRNLPKADQQGLRDVLTRLSTDSTKREPISKALVNLIDKGDLSGTMDRVEPVHDWNEGSLERLLGSKGTMKSNTRNVIDALTDPVRLKQLKAEASERGSSELAALLAARRNLNHEVYSRAAKNWLKHTGGRVGAILAGLGLAGYGSRHLLKSDK